MRTLMMLVMGAVLLAAMVLPAAAKQTPSICGERAFSAPTKYMSLAGYVRWQQYTARHAWMTRSQATRLTAQQLRTCPMPGHS